MSARRRTALLGACLTACLPACDQTSTAEAPPPASAPVTPDRLAEGERLPESEMAFGLVLPPGMRLVRHFNESAYFAGDLELDAVLEHVRSRVETPSVQLLGQGALIERARITGDEKKRLFRISLSKVPRGTQLHIKDITPPQALSGFSEEELWRVAGRKPDGTPLDPNQLY